MNIQVGGTSYEVPDGANISVVNNVLFVDGKEYSGDYGTSKQLLIQIIGNPSFVAVDRGNVDVQGNIEKLKAGGNAIISGSVTGGVAAGGNVKCGAISGSVSAGGNVIHQ